MDDDALGDRRASVTHSATGGRYDLTGVDTVAVAVTDDDVAGLTVAPASVTVDETGGTATYTVVLTAKPTADVTVSPTSSDTSAATASPRSLTFHGGQLERGPDRDGDGR